MTSASVLAAYQDRITELERLAAGLHTKQATALLLVIVALAAAGGLCFLAFARRSAPKASPVVPAALALLCLRRYSSQYRELSRNTRLRGYYQRGVERLNEEWPENGSTGESFAQPGHIYASDLGLFGAGSLFEQLSTGRTEVGRECLARYLQDPADLAEIRGRQAAVRELSPGNGLREEIAVLGRYGFRDVHGKTFRAWLELPPAGFPAWLRWAALVGSVAMATLLATCMLMPSQFAEMVPILLPVAAANGMLGLLWQIRVRRVIAAATPVAGEIAMLREALTLVSQQRFECPKLVELAARVRPAATSLSTLQRWLRVLEERSKEWFYAPALILLAGTQAAFAVEAWRERHGSALLAAIDAFAELEALSALACYAHENPEDCWPEVVDGDASFAAAGLGHPLLARRSCVANDVRLGGADGFIVLTGSNMAGKSTLLRSIGVAAVLAFAGAPVRARSLRLSVMRLAASISVTDSLRDGRSKFLAEVERLRETLGLAALGPVLFLIDEIFSGTNSHDRQIAAAAVIQSLADAGATGVVSTHDTALAAIAGHGGVNSHMASRPGSADPLDFDYLLRPGVTTESNALAIARLAGVLV